MKNIYKALADFQQEVPVILKDTTGYGYKYADLPAIFEVINPLLKKNGLGFFQGVDSTQDNIPFVRTVIFHIESGEVITSQTIIPQGVQLKGMNDFQVFGAGITYLRRYALSSLLGLVTDKDEDMAGKQKKVESVDTAKKLTPDEAMSKALKALEDADTLIDLTEIRTQIKKSKILLPEQKNELEILYQKKSETFDPTK